MASLTRLLSASCGLLAMATAQPLTLDEPSADRWVYPVNTTPGARAQASSFSALPGDSGSDDRFGYFLIRFDTGSIVPAGFSPSAYRIESLVLTATIGQDRLFRYDPSPDPVASFGTPAAPASVDDPDPGRPLDLLGAGFRNEFTADTFQEDSPEGGQAGPGTRNAFPLGFDQGGQPRDVANNASEGFEPLAWATGTTAEVAIGELVPTETRFRFVVDASMPGVRSYLQEGLSAGRLWLTLSSLHPATQQGGEFVAWLTRDDAVHQLFGGLAPTLTLDVHLDLPLHLERSGNRSSLRWEQRAGFTYELLASDDLGHWGGEAIHLAEATTDGPGSFIETTPASRRFYRLRVTPGNP